MPDTIKTLAQLNQDFGDNTVGQVSPQFIRDLMVSMMVHGEIGSAAKASITLPAAPNFAVVDLNVAGVAARGITVDTVNKRLADVPVAMKAHVTAELWFRGTNGTTYDIAVFQNGSQVQRLTRQARIVNAAQIPEAYMGATIQCAANDTFDLRVRAGGAAFELLFGVLRLQRIGVE